MSFSFSQTAGTSGITVVTVSATSTTELVDIVKTYKLSNETKEIEMGIVQRAYVPLEYYIYFQPSSISMDSSGGTASLNIQSNDEWVIASDDWILMNGQTSLSGSGNTIVGIRFNENTGSSRNGVISGYCKSDTSKTASTEVEQSGHYVQPYLTLGQNQYNAESSGQSGCSLSVYSNLDWEATTNDRWITIHTISGSNDGTILFDIQENNQTLPRGTVITVSSLTESLSAQCEVIQKAVEIIPYIIISPTSETIPLSGGSFALSVSSNTYWEVSIEDNSEVSTPWIGVDKLNGNGDDVITVTVASALTESRSASISIENESLGLKEECLVEQKMPTDNTKVFYTSTDGNIITPSSTDWGANLISNTYENGQGILGFDGEVTEVPDYAFSRETKLSTITIPDSVTNIGYEAFFRCTGLNGTLTLPNSLETIGGSAFYQCTGLTGQLTIPDKVTIIYYGTFYNCSGFTSLTLSNSFETIGDYAFYGCSGLTGVLTIPDSVTNIGTYSFAANGSSLTKLILGSSVNNIGTSAFQGHINMTEIYSYAKTEPTLSSGAFRWLPSQGTLHYPNGSNYSTFISALPSGWTAIADL